LNRAVSSLLLAASILLSLGGIAAFIVLFVLEFNVYWLILSPVIFAVYQIPAVFVYWIWKRKRRPVIQGKLPEVKKNGGENGERPSVDPPGLY
jgi:hypothetical protein